MTGDSVWNKDLYRHLQRQGLSPENEYVMQHDIYSLGVCLLEIGLWESFVGFKQGEKATPAPADWLQQYIVRTGIDSAARVKEKLVELAEEILPSRMGKIYSRIVMTCLTCLEKDNVDFGNPEEFEDEDGVQVGVRYIEKVSFVFPLGCCILMGSDYPLSQPDICVEWESYNRKSCLRCNGLSRERETRR